MCLQFHVVVCVCHSKISRKMEIKWKFVLSMWKKQKGRKNRALRDTTAGLLQRPRAWVDPCGWWILLIHLMNMCCEQRNQHHQSTVHRQGSYVDAYSQRSRRDTPDRGRWPPLRHLRSASRWSCPTSRCSLSRAAETRWPTKPRLLPCNRENQSINKGWNISFPWRATKSQPWIYESRWAVNALPPGLIKQLLGLRHTLLFEVKPVRLAWPHDTKCQPVVPAARFQEQHRAIEWHHCPK